MAYPSKETEIETVKYGFITFRCLIKRKEIITAADMAKRIKQNYDIKHPRTAEVVRCLEANPLISFKNTDSYLT